MTGKERSKKGKELAFLLRHDKDYEFDSHGWRETSDLTRNHGYTKAELEEIVSTDDKGRYEWNQDKSKIRARQGHSIEVDVDLEEKEPPEVLYHGTSGRFIDSIIKTGIKKMQRTHVHLSPDKETASKVGTRHGGSLMIIEVKAHKMWEDGCKFYLSRNGVWLTDYVNYQKYGTLVYDE